MRMIPMSGNGRRVLLGLVKFVLITVVVWFTGRALFQRIEDLDWSMLHPAPLTMLAAVVLLVVDKIVSVFDFKFSLLSFGRDLHTRKILWARLASLPGRYVPGRVAASGGMALILARYGIPGTIALGSTTLPTIINLLVGLSLSVPLLFITTSGSASMMPAWPALVLLAVILAVVLHPKLLLRFVNTILRRIGRDPLPVPAGRPLLLAALVMASRYILSGAVIYLLALSLEPLPMGLLPLVIFANAFAFIAGFIVFFVPAGLGIRESALLVLLGVTVPSIALVAVVFRLLDVVSDVLLGAIGAYLVGRSPSVLRKVDTSGSERGDR